MPDALCPIVLSAMNPKLNPNLDCLTRRSSSNRCKNSTERKVNKPKLKKARTANKAHRTRQEQRERDRRESEVERGTRNSYHTARRRETPAAAAAALRCRLWSVAAKGDAMRQNEAFRARSSCWGCQRCPKNDNNNSGSCNSSSNNSRSVCCWPKLFFDATESLHSTCC